MCFGKTIRDLTLKFREPKRLFKRLGILAAVLVIGWCGIFHWAIFFKGSGKRFYSPNCRYYVIYRQSLWQKITDDWPYDDAFALLYDNDGHLLYKHITSFGNGFEPAWIGHGVGQGGGDAGWNYTLPASGGDLADPNYRPINCLAMNHKKWFK